MSGLARVPLFPDQSRPLLFAHRGLSFEAPENTMAAFRLAVERGVPGIELDIHRCASGELVVFHDDTSTRTAPGTALALRQTSWERLRELDVGSWKGETWRGERPVLLAEVLEEFGSRAYFDIEIKARTTEETGCEAALARLLADFRLDAASVAVSSFNPVSLQRFKAEQPDIPTAIIYCHSKELPWYLRGGQGALLAKTDYLKPEHILVKPLLQVSAALSRRGIIPWTVDDPERARHLLDHACQGIISNKADHLLRFRQSQVREKP